MKNFKFYNSKSLTLRTQTKLVNPKIVETLNLIEPTTTDVLDLTSTIQKDLPNIIQKDYVSPMYFGDDLDIHQNIINKLPSPFLSLPRNADEANQDFQKFIYAQHQKHIELARLKLSQDSIEKFDVFVNKKCLKELQSYQSEGIETIGYQVLGNLNLVNNHQIDLEHL